MNRVMKTVLAAAFVIAVVGVAGYIFVAKGTPKADPAKAAVDTVTPAAVIGNDGTTSLGDLIVLNSLFNGTGTASTRDLAGLIAVDRIVGNDGSYAGGGTTSLGDLIVLNSLFNTSATSTKDLAGLIAVDRVVGNTGDGTFSDGTTSLGDLIVLNNLFGNSATSTKDLAGLIAVDRIVQ